MKLFANGLSNDKDLAILKDNEKFNKDVSVDDITTSNATKKANEAKSSNVNSFAVPINSAANEEQARQCLRHLWLYERRMDKGLFCALGFIIILCLVGMATSIGGALYLKFRSQPIANTTPTHIAPESAGFLGDNLIEATKATDDAEGMSGFRIRVNISLPALDNLASDATESETLATISPFEDTIWEEIRRRNGLGGDAMSGFGNNGNDKSEVSTDSVTKVDEVEVTPSFTSVNKHRVLQQPPSFSDFMTFIRKTLRIPTIKIVRDSHE